MSQAPRVRNPLNKIPGQDRWLWTQLPRRWRDYADEFGDELGRGLRNQPTAEGRIRHSDDQAAQARVGARGVVAYFLATGQAVPPIGELLRRDRDREAEAHYYKIRTATILWNPDYGFIWHARDTRYRNVTHFLLMHPFVENSEVWALVGEASLQHAREMSVPARWTLTPENLVLRHESFSPYAGPSGGPPAAFEYCPHGEPIGTRCFGCQPFRRELFPPRDGERAREARRLLERR